MATDQNGVPLFPQTFSGNESDKKILLAIITQLAENLQHPGKVYYNQCRVLYGRSSLILSRSWRWMPAESVPGTSAHIARIEEQFS